MSDRLVYILTRLVSFLHDWWWIVGPVLTIATTLFACAMAYNFGYKIGLSL